MSGINDQNHRNDAETNYIELNEEKVSDILDSKDYDTKAINKVDKRLENWKKWVAIRISEQAKISTFTGREPCQSVMNSDECFRYKKEQRQLIDLANNLTSDDPSRKSDNFWILPTELPGKCAHSYPLFAQITSQQKGVIFDLTNIGVPKLIKREKGLCNNYNTSCKSFVLSEYRIKRERDLQKKITRILPHRPEMDELIVIGKGIFKSQDNSLKDVGSENMLESIKSDNTIIFKTVALRIENTILIKEMTDSDSIFLNNLLKQDWHEEKTTWRVHFISKLYNPCSKAIEIHNLGTVPVKYKWQQIKYNITPQLENPSESLAFDKKDGKILPQTKIVIHFLYNPQLPDISYESWEFITDPIMLRDGKILFILHGLATIESTYHKEVMLLRDEILHEVILYAVKNFINTILDRMTFNRPIKISYEQYLCDEELIFSMKNKKTYYYHPQVVKRLTNLYEAILPNSNAKWDLSVMALRKNIIETQNVNRTVLYNEFRECCSLLVKPKYKILLSCNKYVAVFTLLANFLNKFNTFSNEVNYNKRKLIAKNYNENGIVCQKVLYSLIFLEMKTLIEEVFTLLHSMEDNYAHCTDDNY